VASYARSSTKAHVFNSIDFHSFYLISDILYFLSKAIFVALSNTRSFALVVPATTAAVRAPEIGLLSSIGGGDGRSSDIGDGEDAGGIAAFSMK